MITIKRDGRFIIPEGESFIGYAGDNLAATKEFFVEDLTDISLVYRMYLLFDDGTSNFFLLESDVVEGGTKLVWSVTAEQIYKSGIVKMQIKASNSSGLVFHTTTTSLLVHRSIEFAESYAEMVNYEFLQHEKALNRLAERCAEMNETAEQTLDEIRNEKPFSGSDLKSGCISRSKLDSELTTLLESYEMYDYTNVIDLGEVSAENTFNNPSMATPLTRYQFIPQNPLAWKLRIPELIPAELVFNNGYQIVRSVTLADARARRVRSIAPSFNADDWFVVTAAQKPDCLLRFSKLESTIGTLNTELENTLNGSPSV